MTVGSDKALASEKTASKEKSTAPTPDRVGPCNQTSLATGTVARPPFTDKSSPPIDRRDARVRPRRSQRV
jgi:hypothetical protein